jgi:DNA transformation protein and related proteins
MSRSRPASSEARETPVPIADLPNLGRAMARRLAAIGVSTAADLRRMGAAQAYARLRFAEPAGLSLNALYAMDAALSGGHWARLPEERKRALRKAAGLGT